MIWVNLINIFVIIASYRDQKLYNLIFKSFESSLCIIQAFDATWRLFWKNLLKTTILIKKTEGFRISIVKQTTYLHELLIHLLYEYKVWKIVKCA